ERPGRTANDPRVSSTCRARAVVVPPVPHAAGPVQPARRRIDEQREQVDRREDGQREREVQRADEDEEEEAVEEKGGEVFLPGGLVGHHPPKVLRAPSRRKAARIATPGRLRGPGRGGQE